MNRQEAFSQGLELVEKSRIAMLGTNGKDGFPNIKAMFNLKHDGLRALWFSTNTSSQRVRQLKDDPRACLYFVDEVDHKGLLLVGTMKILQDIESKKMLWEDGCENYYPLGVEDPDYSVLCFSPRRGNYYHGLKNISFEIDGGLMG